MKKKIGFVFISGGLLIIGYYLLTLTKPKDTDSQLNIISQKEKDLANSMKDVDNSDITKAKAFFLQWLKLRGEKKQDSDYTKEELELSRNLYSQIRNLNYIIVGNELRHI